MKVTKFSALIFSLIFCIVFCSCQTAPPKSASEEVVLHQWVLKDSKGEKQGELKFLPDDRLCFTAKIGDQTMNLEGISFLDDENIYITSDDWGNIIISYRLEREYLYLTSFEKEIKLEKSD